MSQREKLLAGLVALAVLLWGGTVGLQRYRQTRDRNEELALSTQGELSLATTAALRGRNAQRRLRNWQRQALPTNLDIAKSLYQDWLRQQFVQAKLEVKDIREQSPRISRSNFQQATFIVTASGSLQHLTTFLYNFYQSNHLHRISAANLSPTSNRENLNISLTIDALSLPTSDRTDQLADGSSDTFSEPLEDFASALVGRNIFVAHKPPQPANTKVAEATPQQDDDESDPQAEAAFVTGMTYGADGWQMSIRMNDSGKLRYFRRGDRIDIGKFSGEVAELDGRRVIITNDGGRHELVLGQNLSQARRLSEDRDS